MNQDVRVVRQRKPSPVEPGQDGRIAVLVTSDDSVIPIPVPASEAELVGRGRPAYLFLQGDRAVVSVRDPRTSNEPVFAQPLPPGLASRLRDRCPIQACLDALSIERP